MSIAIPERKRRGSEKDESVGRGSPPKAAKKTKKRVVPGSLLITDVSASGLPDTEKGMFSKQARNHESPAYVSCFAIISINTRGPTEGSAFCFWKPIKSNLGDGMFDSCPLA